MNAAAYFWRMKLNEGSTLRMRADSVSKWVLGLKRHEPLLFLAALCMLLLPVWATEGWYTFDGPAHLYNAEVIGELLWGHEPHFLNFFYEIRWPPAPNLLFYVFAAPLSRVMDIMWIDKLWATLHVLVFGLGFRFFRLEIAGEGRGSGVDWGAGKGRGSGVDWGAGKGRGSGVGRLAAWASWVGLYAVFHRHFFLGQYNFAMGIGLMGWTLGYSWRWIMHHRPLSWPLVRLAGLLTLLGASHLVGFAAAGVVIGLMLIWLNGRQTRQFLTRILCLLAVSSPVLVINLYYLWQSKGTGITRHIGHYDLLGQWIRLESLTSFNPPVEWRTMIGLFVLAILTLPMAVMAVHRRLQRSNECRPRADGAWAFLLSCSVLFVLMYLIIPDESRNSGYLSSRLALISQMFFLAGGVLLLGVVPSAVRRLTLALLLLLLPFRVAYYWKVERSLGRDLSEMRRATAQIPTESTVHQVNLSNNWMHEHLSMSVSGREIVHLKNYEAYLDYFPLGWRMGSLQPWMTHANYWKNWPPCPDTAELAQLSSAPMPDFLIVWDDGSMMTAMNETIDFDCRELLYGWLSLNYLKLPVSESERCSLWKRKLKSNSSRGTRPNK